MTAPKLATFVHVADEHEATHVFGPGDEVPEWAARRIVNPKAWEGGKPPFPYDESRERLEEAARLRARLAELEAGTQSVSTAEPREPSGDGPPPKGGAGSGAPEWRAYAARQGVDVPEDANRDQVIAALTAADVPTE